MDDLLLVLPRETTSREGRAGGQCFARANLPASSEMSTRTVVSARLARLVGECVRASESEADDIQAGKARWRHAMFGTVRLLKGDPETKDLSVEEWTDVAEKCLSACGLAFTAYPGIEDHDHGREEFRAQCMICLYGEGEGPLDLALTRARISPVPFQTECTCERYVPFLNLCDQLQLINGRDPIALPVHDVGKRLGVSGATVGVYVRQAIKEQYLVLIGKHWYNPGGKGKARTFRFHPNRSPNLHGIAQGKCLSDHQPHQ